MPIVIQLVRGVQFLTKNLHRRSVFETAVPSLQLFMEKSMSTESISGDKPLTIGTHDGVFHCDEALGCFLLKILHPHVTIIRSRDNSILDTCNIVIDVGGVYDPERNRFDHHQKTFTHSMSTLSPSFKNTVRLSSAGLIYHHFGRLILEKIIGKDDEQKIDYVYKGVYKNLIQEIDGIDNGIPAYSSEPLYNINSHISARVQRLNKSWNFVGAWDDMEHFYKAMELVGAEFMDNVTRIANMTYPAREIVLNAINKRYEVHPSGEIIELSQQCPWKDHLYEIEETFNVRPFIKYVLFQGEDNYRVMGVSLTSRSFVCRKFLPKSWCGLRDDALSKEADIEGCIFVHSSGFIGGNTTREGTLKMASKSLEMDS